MITFRKLNDNEIIQKGDFISNDIIPKDYVIKSLKWESKYTYTEVYSTIGSTPNINRRFHFYRPIVKIKTPKGNSI